MNVNKEENSSTLTFGTAIGVEPIAIINKIIFCENFANKKFCK